MAKRVHKAVAVNQRGGVAALCSPVPRAISMTKASWTLDDKAVTCPKCVEMIRLEDHLDAVLIAQRAASLATGGR